MTRSHAAYVASAIFLALVAIATLMWAFSTIPSPEAPLRAAAATPEPQAPVAVVLPADKAISGSASEIADAAEVGEAVATSVQRARVCGTELSSGLRSDSARISAPNLSVTILVSAWRAGSASAAFQKLRKTAQNCFVVNSVEDKDVLHATSSTNGGAQTGLSAVRTGDVLTVTTVTGLNTDPSAITAALTQSTRDVLRARLKGVCADASSASAAQDGQRDPYGGSYDGWKIPRLVAVPDVLAVNLEQVSAAESVSPDATWRAPAPRPVATLAPFSRPPRPKPTLTPAPTPVPSPGDTTLPTPTPTTPRLITETPKPLPAPRLTDPISITPPTQAEPPQDAGPRPPAPGAGPEASKAMVPALDKIGPGCGWHFTETSAPVWDAEVSAQKTRSAVIAALVATTAKQGRRMVEKLTWPQRYRTWAATASARADWQLYRDALQSARNDWATAQRRQQISIERWSELGVAVPELTPSRSQSPGPTRSGR